MKRLLVAMFLLSIPTSAFAQAQPAQAQPKPSVQEQLMSMYTTLNMNLAKQLDAAAAENVELQKQLDAANAKVKDLSKESPAK